MNSLDLSKDPLMIDMRKSIDHFDTSFLQLLAERMRIVKKIMYVKLQANIDLKQSEARIKDMKELIEMSVQLKLEKSFFEKILNLVFYDAMAHFRYDKDGEEAATMATICEGLTLQELRRSLLNLDKSICIVLAERFCIVKRIGHYKGLLNVAPLDPVRWENLLAEKADMAEKLGISVSLVKDIFNTIHAISLNLENDVIADG